MTDTLFWDVDTQNDFIEPDGALPVPGAEDIRGELARLSSLVTEGAIQRVSTGDWHSLDDEEIDENLDEPDPPKYPPHCMAGSRGAQFIPETTPILKRIRVKPAQNATPTEGTLRDALNVVIHKTRFDVFEGNPHTGEVLDVLDPDEVFVYGVSGNVCVKDAVNGLLDRGLDVTVVEDAVENLPASPPAVPAWEDLKQRWKKQGVEFTTTDEVVARFS